MVLTTEKLKLTHQNLGIENNWSEDPTSAYINKIVQNDDPQGNVKALFDTVEERSKRTEKLADHASHDENWIDAEDSQGNPVRVCPNGENDYVAVSITPVPDAYRALIPTGHKFAKLIITDMVIADGQRRTKTLVSTAETALEDSMIIMSIMGIVVRGIRVVMGIRDIVALMGAAQADGLIPQAMHDPVDLPGGRRAAVQWEFVEGDAMADEMVAGFAVETVCFLVVGVLIFVALVIIMYLIYEAFVSSIFIVNLSKKNFRYCLAYNDNIDKKSLPLNFRSGPKDAFDSWPLLPKFNAPVHGFTPKAPTAHSVITSFVNDNKWLEGVGSLIKLQSTASELDTPGERNLLHHYEVKFAKDNRHAAAIDHTGDDYRSFYQDHDSSDNKTLRVDTQSNGLRIVSQTHALGGESDHIYRTAVIILDA